MFYAFKIAYDLLDAFSFLPENQRTAQPWTAEDWALRTVEMLSVRSLGWIRGGFLVTWVTQTGKMALSNIPGLFVVLPRQLHLFGRAI